MLGWVRLTGRFQMSNQDAENVRQRRSRIVQTLNVPYGYASGLRSLRPCWTIVLSILLDVQTSPSLIVAQERGDSS
jgi:hypothetical protein